MRCLDFLHSHKHKVEDTRKRSLLKALTGNGLEVIFDTIIFGFIFVTLGMELPEAAGIGFGLSIMVEILCAITNYFNDRAWNKIQWGRKVEDVSYVVKGLEEGIKNKKLLQKVLENIENIDTSTTPLTEEELKEMYDEMEMWQKASDEDWEEFVKEYDV